MIQCEPPLDSFVRRINLIAIIMRSVSYGQKLSNEEFFKIQGSEGERWCSRNRDSGNSSDMIRCTRTFTQDEWSCHFQEKIFPLEEAGTLCRTLEESESTCLLNCSEWENPEDGTKSFPVWIILVSVGGVVLFSVCLLCCCFCQKEKLRWRRSLFQVDSEIRSSPSELELPTMHNNHKWVLEDVDREEEEAAETLGFRKKDDRFRANGRSRAEKKMIKRDPLDVPGIVSGMDT